MRDLALAVAGWWVTWLVFGVVAWGGLVLLICWAGHRFWRMQDSHDATLAAETAHATDDADIEWQRIVRAIKEDGL